MNFQIGNHGSIISVFVKRLKLPEVKLNFSNFRFRKDEIDFVWRWIRFDIKAVTMIGTKFISFIESQTNIFVSLLNFKFTISDFLPFGNSQVLKINCIVEIDFDIAPCLIYFAVFTGTDFQMSLSRMLQTLSLSLAWNSNWKSSWSKGYDYLRHFRSSMELFQCYHRTCKGEEIFLFLPSKLKQQILLPYQSLHAIHWKRMFLPRSIFQNNQW